MIYIGIKNYKCKRIAVLNKKIGRIIEVKLPCLTAPDCERHFDMLKLFDQGICDVKEMKNTLYYKFNKENNRKHKAIQSKILGFLKLYRSIINKGYDYSLGYIVISKDGARLDGSHRAAIVEHLGYQSLKVRLIKWQEYCSTPEIKSIRDHLIEQRKLYNVRV